MAEDQSRRESLKYIECTRNSSYFSIG